MRTPGNKRELQSFRAPTRSPARRCAYDVATGSVTAVYERCGENIRSSRRSSATVNFRPPIVSSGKGRKGRGSRGAQRDTTREITHLDVYKRHVQRLPLPNFRVLTTRLFHSFAGRSVAEMTPILRVRRRCSDSMEFTTRRGVRTGNPAENGTCG
ncbi:Uncharacterized protein DBV15_06043 [Temnothorax longispinosus]|uniref:Uncharacterized protein n=1 Tax=Temnothorax longispinosus TaxID=300112 RepID=A0A4V3SC93_9HYME|nr:Uncharacterized protein DBV15_06043 [Temnothorax longispinosus]